MVLLKECESDFQYPNAKFWFSYQYRRWLRFDHQEQRLQTEPRLECPERVRSSWPVLTFHSLILPSLLSLARIWPLGLIAIGAVPVSVRSSWTFCQDLDVGRVFEVKALFWCSKNDLDKLHPVTVVTEVAANVVKTHNGNRFGVICSLLIKVSKWILVMPSTEWNFTNMSFWEHSLKQLRALKSDRGNGQLSTNGIHQSVVLSMCG